MKRFLVSLIVGMITVAIFHSMGVNGDCLANPDCGSCSGTCAKDENPPHCYSNGITMAWRKKFGACLWQ
ncbi:hypothetical protein WDU94_009905 [Cyamophila willieti]